MGLPIPWRLVSIDIDGTLTTVHGWSVIADRAKRRAEYEATNRRFFDGREDETTHLRSLVDLARGISRDQFDGILASIPKIGGIREAVEILHRDGVRVALLTHNPPWVTDWYAARYGFDDADGIADVPPEDDPLPRAGAIRADKVGGLARLALRADVPRRDIVHVGDGAADAEVFPLVGAGVALNSTLPAVADAADLALTTSDLRELVDRLRYLPRRLE
jgi:phosphoserine phosphatase